FGNLNDTSSSVYPDDKSSNYDEQIKFGSKDFRESLLSSTLGPSSSESGAGGNIGVGDVDVDDGGNQFFYYDTTTAREDSQEVRGTPTPRRKVISFLCIKRRPRSYDSNDGA